MRRKKIIAENELPPGQREIFQIGNRSVGLFNVDGEYFALRNKCAHLDGPVCKGKIQGELVAEYKGANAGVEENFSEEPVIACPWHGWEYRLDSGTHVGDTDVSLETFDVETEDGYVYIVLDE